MAAVTVAIGARGMAGSPPILIRTYTGRTQQDAALAFQQDAAVLASSGYFPVSQSWADGRPGAGRVLMLGLLAGAMKPDGTLTVTYQRAATRPPASLAPRESTGGFKICPQCAEEVRLAARVCRFCRYEFPPEPPSGMGLGGSREPGNSDAGLGPDDPGDREDTSGATALEASTSRETPSGRLRTLMLVLLTVLLLVLAVAALGPRSVPPADLAATLPSAPSSTATASPTIPQLSALPDPPTVEPMPTESPSPTALPILAPGQSATLGADYSAWTASVRGSKSKSCPMIATGGAAPVARGWVFIKLDIKVGDTMAYIPTSDVSARDDKGHAYSADAQARMGTTGVAYTVAIDCDQGQLGQISGGQTSHVYLAVPATIRHLWVTLSDISGDTATWRLF